jgi:polysaccharide biosynthesis protein PslH
VSKGFHKVELQKIWCIFGRVGFRSKNMSLFSEPVAKPKILFVTSHWPLADAYGAQQRVLNLARLMSRFGEVSFVIVSTDPEDEPAAIRTRREFKVHGFIRPMPVPAGHHGSLTDRLRHEFDPTYLVNDPFAVDEHDRAWFQSLLQSHDLVWVHTIRTANWFRIYRWPHSVLDVDDLISTQQWTAARSTSSLSKRLMHLRRWGIWRRRERLFAKRFDVLTVCSEQDRRLLGSSDQVHVIPNGACPLDANSQQDPSLPRIGFLGNCGFAPNEEGVKWFIREVWPIVKRSLPDAQLRLIGRGSDGYLASLGPDIQGLGWLADPGDEMATWSAMIVPIKEGSGTRTKVAEGFSRKCPVVATRLGAFGYEVQDGEDILLADQAEKFALACVRLAKSPELRKKLSDKAHGRFLERWTWDSFESRVGDVVRQCLAKSNRAKPSRHLAELQTL